MLMCDIMNVWPITNLKLLISKYSEDSITLIFLMSALITTLLYTTLCHFSPDGDLQRLLQTTQVLLAGR